MNGKGSYKEPNKPIKVLTKQSIKDKLKELALEAKTNPIVFIQMEDIYGNLAQNEYFANTFSKFLNSIWENGVENTVINYNKQ